MTSETLSPSQRRAQVLSDALEHAALTAEASREARHVMRQALRDALAVGVPVAQLSARTKVARMTLMRIRDESC